MTAKEHQQFLIFETIGINIQRHTFSQCIDILIDKYLDLAEKVEETEKDRFLKEIKRIQKPTN